MIGVLASLIITDPHGSGFGGNFGQIIGAVSGIFLYAIVGSICTVFSGCFALLLMVLFDHSLGKVFSPTLFSAASIGLSVIPISVMGIFAQAFSTYPDSEWFACLYYVPTIIAGYICGIWGSNLRIVASPSVARTKWQLGTLHLFALTGWVTLMLALGFGNVVFLVAASIYVTIVALVVTIYNQFKRRVSSQSQIGE